MLPLEKDNSRDTKGITHNEVSAAVCCFALLTAAFVPAQKQILCTILSSDWVAKGLRHFDKAPQSVEVTCDIAAR